ncbi:MAG: DUF4215 domain-containing protein, partial [Kofleriaceae bacterium]
GEPSTCTTVCGDGVAAGDEACDDGNAIETDGCTSACVIGVVCDATAVPGGSRFAVDPATGHCYVSFDSESTTFAGAQAACAATGGYLATITSASEDAVVRDVQNPAETPWIGASEDANDTDDVFAWVTGEPFGYSHFAAGQPDDDASTDGLGDCLHLVNSAGEWNDTNCDATTFVVGRICEIELQACGDHVIQSTEGEECDDGNATGGDGCSATCQIEDGCGDGNLDPGEQCDDDNVVSGDGCSATCQFEQTCGNGVREGTEECDDGNTGDGDGCSATCELESAPTCGNGTVDAGEQCDDGNTASGDGCSSTCRNELDLATFTFTGNGGNEVTAAADGSSPAPGLASIPVIRRGSGLSATAASGAFGAGGWTTGTTIDENDYFSFTVTPAAGFTVSLLKIKLDEKRSGTGIRNWLVRSSLDGYTTDLATFSVPDNDLTRTNQTITLPAAAFSHLSTAVEFRIYGYAAEAAGGSWRVDNLVIHGSTDPL